MIVRTASLLALVGLFFAAGCTGVRPPASVGQATPLEGTSWQVASFGEASSSRPALGDARLTVAFDSGRVAGMAGCNRYFGSYSGSGSALRFSQVGATKMMCTPPEMEREDAFLAALDKVRGWTRSGDEMTVTDASGGVLMRLVQAQELVKLTGVITYLPRIALPPNAVVQVRLEDVSRADAPSETLAEQKIYTQGRQVPIPFELEYDPARIDARNRYAVRAEIRDNTGVLIWTTDTVHPVLTQEAPTTQVEVRVVQATPTGAAPEAGDFVGPTWHLTRIERPGQPALVPETDEPYSITFLRNGEYNGQAHCNRYAGQYGTGANGALTLDAGLTTLAACGPRSSSDAFFSVFNAARHASIAGGQLRLRAGDGSALVFERSDTGGMEPQLTGETMVFDCADDFSVTVRTGPGELAVWLPERFGSRYVVLGQTHSASGARYEGDGVRFWDNGPNAQLQVDGASFECRKNARRAVWEEARRQGVDFRAVGQEPGWVLEIRDAGRLSFVYNYGEGDFVVDTPAPSTAAGRTTYHARTGVHDLTVTVEDKPCTDVMSGEPLPATVTVQFDGQTYNGCGISLR